MSRGRLLITGANGNLGALLLQHLDANPSGFGEVRALVRSQRAADRLRGLDLPMLAPEIRIVDYTDVAGMTEAASGCDAAVHLVGILKETASARYVDAHERCCEVLVQAARLAGLRHVVYLSILGASPDSANACLASKGRAEVVLMDGTPTTVLRVPMVIGPGDHASRALRGQANAPFLFLVGGGRTWQQPLDAADLIRAVLAALERGGAGSRALDLAGPEALQQRELVTRVAALHGRRPRILPIPVGLARGLAALAARWIADPPVTPAMLEVLEHDDRIDPKPAFDELGLTPTPLDETLRRYTGPEEGPR